MDPDGFLTTLGYCLFSKVGASVTSPVNLEYRDDLAVDMITLECSLPSCRVQNTPWFTVELEASGQTCRGNMEENSK